MRSAKAGPVTAIIAAAAAENSRIGSELADRLFLESIEVAFAGAAAAATTACCLPVGARAAIVLRVDACVEARVERMVLRRERGAGRVMRERKRGKRSCDTRGRRGVCVDERERGSRVFLDLLSLPFSSSPFLSLSSIPALQSAEALTQSKDNRGSAPFSTR